MARVNAALLSMNRGEISKLALARVDLAKLQCSAQVQVNWLPSVAGHMALRPGMLYVGEVDSDNPCLPIDFIYSRTDTALLELTNLKLRVWINDVLLSRVAVGTTISDPNFNGGGTWSTADTTDGCTANISGGFAGLIAAARGGLARIKQTLTIAGGDQGKEHGLRVVVQLGPVTIRVGSADGLQDYMTSTEIDTGTHSLAFTPTSGNAYLQIETTDTWTKLVDSCSIEAAGTVSIPTPWNAATLPTLRWDQSKDIVYVAQYGGQQYKIERRGIRPGARGWSVVVYTSNTGPFLDLPTVPNLTLTPSVYEGNGTLAADRPFFQPGHVGALFRLFTRGQNNQTTLGAKGAYTDPIRVSGVTTADRAFKVNVAGTFVGTLNFERSLVGPTSGFSVVGSFTAGLSALLDDSAGSPNYSNIVVWYRVGFGNDDYASGSCTVSFLSGGGTHVGASTGSGCTQGGQYGICRVIGYTSPTSVNIEVLSYGALNGGGAFSSIAGTTNWQEGAWSGVQGWPTAVAFCEGRLGWFSAANFPIALSQSNNYTGYASADMNGAPIGDSGVILADFGSGPADRINWAIGLQRLLLGREQSVASVRSSSFDTPLTPTDFSVKDCSQQGAARLPAIKVGSRGIFVQEAGAKVYELGFLAQAADYVDRDLTRLNHDIGKPGFTDIAKATQPDTLIYFPRTEGQVACLVYDPNDEVEAWWRVMTLGVVENVRTLPNWAGGNDSFVYFVVKRVINGVTKRFIEKFAQRRDCAGGLSNQQLDCAYVYSGAPVSTITIPWLPNTTVSVWADGAFIGTGTTNGSGVLAALPDGLSHASIVAGLAGATVSYSGDPATAMTGLTAYNGLPGEFFADQQPSGRMAYIGTLVPAGGQVALPNGITSANIVGFFGYMAPFMSAKLAYGAQGGSALNQKKQLGQVGLTLFDAASNGIQFGQSFDHLDALPLYEDEAAVAAAGVWSEYDEPVIDVAGEWDADARLCLLAQAPNPCKVGGVVVGVATNER